MYNNPVWLSRDLMELILAPTFPTLNQQPRISLKKYKIIWWPQTSCYSFVDITECARRLVDIHEPCISLPACDLKLYIYNNQRLPSTTQFSLREDSSSPRKFHFSITECESWRWSFKKLLENLSIANQKFYILYHIMLSLYSTEKLDITPNLIIIESNNYLARISKIKS